MKKVFAIIVIAILFTVSSVYIYTKKTTVIQKIVDKGDLIPTKILQTGLPDKHLIETAFIPQAPEKNWDEPWQDACEEASLLTVDYFYQNKTPSRPELLDRYQQVFSYEAQNNWSTDIYINQMAQLASEFLGYRTEIINNPTLDQIKKYLSTDIPIIITANGKTLYQENKRFKNGGPWYHSLVILGYDDNRQQFTVHDVGTQFGAYFKYSYSLLMSSIHDFPASGKKEDIDSGDKKVLVLLK